MAAMWSTGPRCSRRVRPRHSGPSRCEPRRPGAAFRHASGPIDSQRLLCCDSAGSERHRRRLVVEPDRGCGRPIALSRPLRADLRHPGRELDRLSWPVHQRGLADLLCPHTTLRRSSARRKRRTSSRAPRPRPLPGRRRQTQLRPASHRGDVDQHRDRPPVAARRRTPVGVRAAGSGRSSRAAELRHVIEASRRGRCKAPHPRVRRAVAEPSERARTHLSRPFVLRPARRATITFWRRSAGHCSGQNQRLHRSTRPERRRAFEWCRDRSLSSVGKAGSTTSGSGRSRAAASSSIAPFSALARGGDEIGVCSVWTFLHPPRRCLPAIGFATATVTTPPS